MSRGTSSQEPLGYTNKKKSSIRSKKTHHTTACVGFGKWNFNVRKEYFIEKCIDLGCSKRTCSGSQQEKKATNKTVKHFVYRERRAAAVNAQFSPYFSIDAVNMQRKTTILFASKECLLVEVLFETLQWNTFPIFCDMLGRETTCITRRLYV